MDAERRFTADAAHELRTPIAAIRAQAQVALGEADDAQRRHALEATLEGCDRATRLVEQLLTLSRLETGAAPRCRTGWISALSRGRPPPKWRRVPSPGSRWSKSSADTPCPVMGDATLPACWCATSSTTRSATALRAPE